jgi:hypothetical protein
MGVVINKVSVATECGYECGYRVWLQSVATECVWLHNVWLQSVATECVITECVWLQQRMSVCVCTESECVCTETECGYRVCVAISTE